jgi:hypothetical protein
MTSLDFIWFFVYGGVWLAIGYGCYLRGNYLRKDGRPLQAAVFWLLAAVAVAVVVGQVLIQTVWVQPVVPP